MSVRQCDECKGTGYWSNYPPKPGVPLDMGDCCGVCCGKGEIEETSMPCHHCGDDGPNVVENKIMHCAKCEKTSPFDNGECAHGTHPFQVCEPCNAGLT